MSTPSAELEGKAAATKFRNDYGLGMLPLTDLVALIETSLDIDVTVLEVEANGGEHGLTVFDPKRNATFIGVAKTNHPMRQRSTLAHELSHAIFQDWMDFQQPVPVVREFREKRADAFARHLLVPEDSLRWFLQDRAPNGVSLRHLSDVVQRFLVSPAMAAIALCSAGLISPQTKTAWMALRTPGMATQFGWLDQYRILQVDSSRTRAPQRLLTRAIRGYQQGVVTVETVASIRGVPISEVKVELDAAGIGPMVVEPEVMRAEDLPDVQRGRSFLGALEALDEPDDLGRQAAGGRTGGRGVTTLPIMDAGPGLNFFSLNKERMLFEALGPLCVPETVHIEMIRKAQSDQRFARTQNILGKLPAVLLEILSDDATGPLRESFERLAQMPMTDRLKNGKDLGELMVVAHAAIQAEQGHEVTVLIDDQGGQRIAAHESRRVDRRRVGQPNTGRLHLITTLTVLERSVAGPHLPDPAALRKLYGRMRLLDDGLLPLERTGLLSSPGWSATR